MVVIEEIKNMFLRKKAIQLMAVIFVFSIGGTSVMCISSNTTESITPLKNLPDARDMHRLHNSNIIPSDELSQKMLDALSGDPDAANRIADHYGFGIHDDHESIKWDIIGAENGHYESQYGLTIRLLNNRDDDSRVRGIFWLYGMAQNNYRETNAWLERCGYSLDTARPPDDSRFPDYYLHLSETELVDCKTGALQGNKKAAWLLGKYYEEVEVQSELSEYWYRIGAQNGNPECQYISGQILSNKDDEFDQVRGEFWLKKAEINGYVN
jgi:TPR repeat protein